MRRDQILVSVMVRFPDGSSGCREFTLDAYSFESFMPLDRYHDVALPIPEVVHGKLQIKTRRELAPLVEKQVEGLIMKIIQEKDPIKGYSREEWNEMHKPSLSSSDSAKKKEEM